MNVTQFLTQVRQDIKETEPDYGHLYEPNLGVFPIPFFGRIDKAEILTVGVNPSNGEFKERGWPQAISDSDLAERLLGYFDNEHVAPHPWFRVWSEALAYLGVSYKDGSAAHIDISPRATNPMGELDANEFLRMARRDVKWMFQLLDLLKRPRLLLLAGTVTKKKYINRFLDECAPLHGWSMGGKAEQKGAGRIGCHTLDNATKTLPAFFCSVSPSARNAGVLINRIHQHRGKLIRMLDGKAETTFPSGLS